MRFLQRQQCGGKRVIAQSLFAVVAFAISPPPSGEAAPATAHLPPEFIDEPVVSGWDSPTAFTIDPEGNFYIAERCGKIWRIPADSTDQPSSPFLDLSEETTTTGDLGLLSITIDPDFLYNGFFYASYAVAPHVLFGDKTTESAPTQLRVVRYTADPREDFAKVVTGSRIVLLGDKPGTGSAILAGANPGGALAFGTDGSLLIGTGDGASPSSADAGSDPDTQWEKALSHSLIREKENVGAFRAQLIDSLSGKILRVDPASGDGLPSNPFFDAKNPRSARSLTWALGLRNPFRLAVRPGSGGRYLTDGDPGTITIGDVGWGSAEEINVAKEGGRNFGWPLFEGLVAQREFARLDTRNLDAIDSRIDLHPIPFRSLICQGTEFPNPDFPHPVANDEMISADLTHVHRRPTLEYRDIGRTGITIGTKAAELPIGVPGSPVAGYSARGSCSIAGTWFDGVGYPATYRNAYYHADLRGGWIQLLTFDQIGALTAVRPLLASRRQIIQVATHPTEGILYYLDHTAGELRRIRFTGDVNLPPIARANQSATFGPSPLVVNFDASSSSDPEGASLSYHWDFGDGQSSKEDTPTHTFESGVGKAKAFPITLTVTDPKGLTSVIHRTVSVNNTPPRARITSIRHSDLYEESSDSSNPATIPLRAEVEDAEHGQGNSPELTYRWQTILHHNKHTHDLPPHSKPETETVLPTTPCGFDAYAYRIELTVTDSAGLSTTVQSWLYPNCKCLNRATAEVWRLGHFDPEELTDAGLWKSDPDKDGLSNLLEYALGRRPKEPDTFAGGSNNDPITEPILAFTAPPPGSQGAITIYYNRPEWQPDLTYTLEISEDGEKWISVENLGKEHLPTIHPTGTKGIERVVYGMFEPLPIGKANCHARLRIYLPKTGETAISPVISSSS